MLFRHSDALWADYPNLVPGVLHAGGISANVDVAPQVARFNAIAQARLAAGPESEFPEVQAWRRVFSSMGLKPTQYRCASESLLRRFRKENALPSLHPLVDLCNAVSLAFAIPIAAFDVAKVRQQLEVRYATGAENYLTFGGETEHPEPGEVIFADAAEAAEAAPNAHARRWTNRQSGLSAVSAGTRAVLIVAEALHASAAEDVARLLNTLAQELAAAWPAEPRIQLLSRASPRFEF
ncbi:B3/4 domain-containing protein [Polaromonas sp. CT11-55]|uniref:B3/B4 domain-containing protein n=1 Tax=Polaromonas sp. CT11-55 TaxID=3243045 RepID=UPI0039A4CBAE